MTSNKGTQTFEMREDFKKQINPNKISHESNENIQLNTIQKADKFNLRIKNDIKSENEEGLIILIISI